MATDLFLTTTELDFLLTAQFAVAFAGEAGESPRLGWWRTDLVSEFGGQNLFQRLLPSTWALAALEGARVAARRVEARRRALHHDPDLLRSLFHPGPAVDCALAERIDALKHADAPPEQALPELAPFLAAVCPYQTTEARFADWLSGHAHVETEPTPAGHRTPQRSGYVELRSRACLPRVGVGLGLEILASIDRLDGLSPTGYDLRLQHPNVRAAWRRTWASVIGHWRTSSRRTWGFPVTGWRWRSSSSGATLL